jgi:hypothetical protein
MTYDIPPHITGDTWKGINNITILRNNIPINLTGCKIKMQFRSIFNLASPVVMELLSEKGDIIFISPSLGVISIPERDVVIPVGEYNYDLLVVNPSGKKITYLNGTWKILPRISR